MKKILLAFVLLLTLTNLSAQTLKDKLNKAKNTLVKTPSNDEIVQGLKEALNVGANKSSAAASQVDGYLKNPRLFIPFPPEAEKMKTQLVKLGFQKQVTEFETSLNRAAEEAAKKAAPVFMGAVKNMTVTDGMNVLLGGDTAATHYLRTATSDSLYTQYKPVVQEAIKKVDVTRYWSVLVTQYNKIPGVKKQNPDLEDYVIKRGINGLFLLVADEEKKIRMDPSTRFSSILKSVFGYADTKK
ncbi:MAG: hypothetical protein K0R51_2606 [Cytophagaceae bacterium]|jgi:hypothetical protein|nr:hypothetical protein [Cytophagaceae bacterium]